MRRLVSAMVLAMAITLSGCGGSEEPEQRTTSEQGGGESHMRELKQLPQGFSGGCTEGIKLWTQYQFEPYGAMVRNTPESESYSAGLPGNNQLFSNGWFRDGNVISPRNPRGARGEVWYYVPNPPFKTKGDKGVWVSDAAVRSVFIETPAYKNRNSFFKRSQAAPRKSECELKPTG